MSKQLPERPDLGQLKKQAKDLLDEIQSGDRNARARAQLEGKDADTVAAFALADAQRVLAREYGFASWPKLKLHVETRAEDAAEARLIEAALEGEEEAVETILAERPGLATRSVYAAAALGDEATVAREVQRDAAVATTKGGPREWPPLLYLSFGQCGAGDEPRARAAKTLLASGADPNASWIHPSWPDAPLPALYGATGVNNHPRLARVLLEAGADPNDGESRYHAAQHHHVASLEVLHEFRANFSGPDEKWNSTPLIFLLGGAEAPHAVRAGIRWLLEHGANPNVRAFRATLDQTALHAAIANGWDVEMIALLLQHGADPRLRRGDGRTAYALAVRGGRGEVVALLVRHGVAPEVEPRDEFLGACMRGDDAAARRVWEANQGLADALSLEDRRLALLLAKTGRADALRTLGRFGWNLAVKGGDGEQPLHWAAWQGHAAVVRALIDCGVPLADLDGRFQAPPLGWCAHGSLHRRNPEGDYGAVAEALLAAGASPGNVVGSPEVMAAIRRAQRK